MKQRPICKSAFVPQVGWCDALKMRIHYSRDSKCRFFLVCFRYPILKKFNPLAIRDDKHVVSSYDIQTLSNKKVLRILKLIR